MANQTPRNEMAERLADTVRHARFAKRLAGALAGFGGRLGGDSRERLMLWRKAMPSRLGPRDARSSEGDHEAGGIGQAPPLPSWPSATGR